MTIIGKNGFAAPQPATHSLKPQLPQAQAPAPRTPPAPRDAFDSGAAASRTNALRSFATNFGEAAAAGAPLASLQTSRGAGLSSTGGLAQVGGPTGVTVAQVGPRTVIDTPAAFVDALFNGTLANCDVNIPIDMRDQSSEVFRLIRARLDAEEGPWLRSTYGDAMADLLLDDMTFKKTQGADLSGTRFLQSVSNADLIGCNLSNAEFLGPVTGSAFLYANLDRTTFHGTVDQSDFAFSDITGNPFMGGAPTNSRLTGTSLARPDEALFGASGLPSIHATLIVSSLGRTSLEDWVQGITSTPDVFTQLQSLGVDMSLPLGSSWRSFLYENVQPSGLTNDPRVKPYIFDAIDERYGSYGGPQSLDALYNLNVGGVYPLRDAINRGLAQALLNDGSVSLRDPFNGAVTPRVLEGGWGSGLAFDQWKAEPIQWNTREATYTVYDCALPSTTLDTLLADPSLSATEKARIIDLRADGIVTLTDLQFIPDIDRKVYDALHP